jgi:hypothetical protein
MLEPRTSRGTSYLWTTAPLALVAALLFPTPTQAVTINVGSLVTVSGPSPVPVDADCLAGQFGYLYSNAEVEPSIEVDPADSNRLVASFQQDRWNNGAAQETTIATSSDAGATWTRATVPYQVCLGGPFQRISDPWATVSPDGTMYQMALYEDLDFTQPASQTTGMAVVRSTDHGASWSAPRILDSEPAPDFGQSWLHNHFHDKNSITADPNDSSYVYAIWDNASGQMSPTMFARSSDGGQTWEPARMIYNAATDLHRDLAGTIGNVLRVLPDGTLLDVMVRYWPKKNGSQADLNFDNSETNYDIAVICSTDHGQTWSRRATQVSRILDAFVYEPHYGNYVRSGDIIPSIAVNPSNGNIYIAWQDTTVAWGPSQIRLSVSRNGGRTWSSPITASRTPTSIDAFVPVVAVNASGYVGVFYYDFRNFDYVAGTGPSTDAWLAAYSDDGTSLAYEAETRLTSSTFDILQSPWAGGQFLGDYQGLTTAGDSFLSLFVTTVGNWPNFAPSPDNPNVAVSDANITDVFFRSVTVSP